MQKMYAGRNQRTLAINQPFESAMAEIQDVGIKTAVSGGHDAATAAGRAGLIRRPGMVAGRKTGEPARRASTLRPSSCLAATMSFARARQATRPTRWCGAKTPTDTTTA